MSEVLGMFVRWRHMKDGKPVRPVRGVVCACAVLSGQGFLLLVRDRDGLLHTVSASDVVAYCPTMQEMNETQLEVDGSHYVAREPAPQVPQTGLGPNGEPDHYPCPSDCDQHGPDLAVDPGVDPAHIPAPKVAPAPDPTKVESVKLPAAPKGAPRGGRKSLLDRGDKK